MGVTPKVFEFLYTVSHQFMPVRNRLYWALNTGLGVHICPSLLTGVAVRFTVRYARGVDG